jgi:hypothetical protein
MTEFHKGLGRCEGAHLGSFGYPGRPADPYSFCPQCGHSMVWRCQSCDAPVPDDSAELVLARFCRECGHPYFPDDPAAERDQS